MVGGCIKVKKDGRWKGCEGSRVDCSWDDRFRLRSRSRTKLVVEHYDIIHICRQQRVSIYLFQNLTTEQKRVSEID